MVSPVTRENICVNNVGKQCLANVEKVKMTMNFRIFSAPSITLSSRVYNAPNIDQI